MSESPVEEFLDDCIRNCVTDFFSRAGDPTIVTGFVMVMETMNADGSRSVFTIAPGDRLPHTGLGLMAVAEAEFRDDIQTQLYSCDCPEG